MFVSRPRHASVIRSRAGNDEGRMRHALLATLLGAALLTGCGGDKATPGADAPAEQQSASDTGTPTDTIKIKDFNFIPPEATVKVGQKITIPNADKAPHTLTEETAKASSFDSGTIRGKQTGSVTFQKAGTFKFFCEFHPTMKGTVTVTQ